MPIILIILDNIYKSKMINVYEEVKSREAPTLVITNEKCFMDNNLEDINKKIK